MKLKNNLGESVNSITYSNINKLNHCLVLTVVFHNDDLSKYEYINQNGGYYKLKENVLLKMSTRGDQEFINKLTLNCNIFHK